jgi:recombination protein RecA
MPRKPAKNIDFMEVITDRFANLITTDSKEIKVIHTGATSLDVSLGVGGIPLRRFTEIYGAEGCGKTTLALSIAKSAIKNNGFKVLYCDPEHGLDISRVAQLLGSDVYSPDSFILLQPETMEETLYICETAIQSNEFGLIILDSIASMAPKIVKEKELDDSTMGVVARRLGVFMQRNLYGVANNDIAFIGVNQVRDKFGAYIPTFDSPGGHQWKHACSVRIMLSKSKDITHGDQKKGITVRFVIKKNKVAPPFRAFMFPLMFDTGIDSYRDTVDFATTMGIIGKRGAYYVFDDKTLGNGIVNTIEMLKNDKDTLDKILERCYTMTNQLIVESEEEEYEQESED